MVVGRRIIAVLVGALAISATVHADMMSVSESDADTCQSASSLSDFQQATVPDLFGSPDLAHTNSLYVEFLPDVDRDGNQRPLPLVGGRHDIGAYENGRRAPR